MMQGNAIVDHQDVVQSDRALETQVCKRLHKRCADPTVTPKKCLEEQQKEIRKML
jgi:hypothetical protein